MEGAVKHIIIDNGSGTIKAGHCYSEEPQCRFPCIQGIPERGKLIGWEEKQHYSGEDAIKFASYVDLVDPMENGNVIDWDAMESIWSDLIY